MNIEPSTVSTKTTIVGYVECTVSMNPLPQVLPAEETAEVLSEVPAEEPVEGGGYAPLDDQDTQDDQDDQDTQDDQDDRLSIMPEPSVAASEDLPKKAKPAKQANQGDERRALQKAIEQFGTIFGIHKVPRSAKRRELIVQYTGKLHTRRQFRNYTGAGVGPDMNKLLGAVHNIGNISYADSKRIILEELDKLPLPKTCPICEVSYKNEQGLSSHLKKCYKDRVLSLTDEILKEIEEHKVFVIADLVAVEHRLLKLCVHDSHPKSARAVLKIEAIGKYCDLAAAAARIPAFK
jgi:hypothetical protein